MDLAALSDDALVAHTDALSRMVDAGINDGCREYLIAAHCERARREIAAAREIIDAMRVQPTTAFAPSTPAQKAA